MTTELKTLGHKDAIKQNASIKQKCDHNEPENNKHETKTD